MARQYASLLSPKGNYIAGSFRSPKDQMKNIVGLLSIKSPADLTDDLGEFPFSYSDVDLAVTAAREGFEQWRKIPQADRNEALRKYAAELKRLEPVLAETMSREVGKPLWESKQEVATMINKVDVTLADGMKTVRNYEIPGIMKGTLGVCRYKPHGVFVVLGPFNFPGHLANGHIIPALATGNAVIFKPSEKAPGTGQLMAEAFACAGLPRGVFNLVQGNGEVGRRLATHEGIDGILFTGSYDVGLKIKQDTLQHHWKLLALEMGGKNSSIVLEDSDLDSAILEVLVSAFITCGQRCSATSRVMVQDKIFDEFLKKFHDRAKGFKIGHPLDNPFMGPLVDQPAVDKYLKFTGIAEREGCEVIMRGKQLECPEKGFYVTPSICVVQDNALGAVKKSVYQQNEIFGPNVALYRVRDLDEGIVLANATQYGLAAAVFTKDHKKFEYAADELQVGVLNWNRSTVGASAKLPFGGVKRSGNHFPTAVSAAEACVFPQACLEVAEPMTGDQAPQYPGLTE